MLEQFTVENFKGFEKLTLEDLGHINIFVGKNNTGKTSLLQAVALNEVLNEVKKNETERKTKNILTYEMEEGQLQPKSKGYVIAYLPQLLPQDLMKSFYLENVDSSITFTVKEIEHGLLQKKLQLVHVEPNVDKNNFLLRFLDTELSVGLFVSSEIRDPLNFKMVFQHGGVWFVPASSDFRHLSSAFFGYLDKSTQKKITLLLSQHIEPSLEEIFYDGKGQLHALFREPKENPLELPLESMGDGFTKLLSLAIILFDLSNSLLCFDEPENGFHYSVQSQFWQLLATAGLEHGKQSFIATHSYELLRNLVLYVKENPSLLQGNNPLTISVYRLERNETNSQIDVEKITLEALETLLKYNLEVR